MSGFGSQPFGSSSFGIGVPASTVAPDKRVFRDPRTSDSLSARRIDPFTRDYVRSDTGMYEGMPATLQMVQIAVSTKKGSSAMIALGHELDQITVITAGLEQRVESALREAVAHIVAQKLIEVLGVSMFLAGRDDGLQPGQVHTRFRFRDLTTNTIHEVGI